MKRWAFAAVCFIAGAATSWLLALLKLPIGVCLAPITSQLRLTASSSASPTRENVPSQGKLNLDETDLRSENDTIRVSSTGILHKGQHHQYLRYFELHDQVMELADAPMANGKQQPFSNTAYSRATVVQQAKWLPHRRMCKATCCVEAVAISLDQDKEQIIHGRDSMDLADIHIPAIKNRNPKHMRFHAQNFNEALLPCLVPGTIIAMDNHAHVVAYFWETLRPKINVPYVIMTTSTDEDSPGYGLPYVTDPRLMRWYGTNPGIREGHDYASVFEENIHKFHPMNLGLSGYNHPQERYMLPYQKLNKFSNPFLDKSRWDMSQKTLDFDNDVFVHFGLDRVHRRALWKSLCANTTTIHNGVSCGQETKKVPVDQVYSEMSRFRFGISPRGAGYDCYRTYEMLLLGIIPIIEERIPFSGQLFEGLPVIQMPRLGGHTSKQDIVEAIHNYTTSSAFLNASFEAGWGKLVLHNMRQQVLKDTGRDKEILADEHGREYYQGYKYTILGAEHGKYRVCGFSGNDCKIAPRNRNTLWLQDPPQMGIKDREWLREWLREGRINVSSVPGLSY